MLNYQRVCNVVGKTPLVNTGDPHGWFTNVLKHVKRYCSTCFNRLTKLVGGLEHGFYFP